MKPMYKSVFAACIVLGMIVAPSAATAQESGTLDQVVKGKKNYAQFRKAVLGAKWTPLVDPQCQANVYGRDGGPKDASNICTQLPEIEACSGDGHCSMNFEHKPSGKKIRVVTYGDYTRWNRSGEEDDLAVSEWSYQ